MLTDNNRLNIWLLAEQLCAEHGLNFYEELDYYANYGYIISSPSSLCVFECIAFQGELCFEVWLIVGEGSIPALLNQMPFWCPQISFARPHKTNQMSKPYDTERLCRAFGVDPEPLKKRIPCFTNNSGKS